MNLLPILRLNQMGGLAGVVGVTAVLLVVMGEKIGSATVCCLEHARGFLNITGYASSTPALIL